MLLTIDAGNTNLCFGLYEGDRLQGSFRLRTDPSQTADELGLLVCEYFHRFGLDLAAVEDVIIACVVPGLLPLLKRAMETYLGKTPLVIDGGVDPGLKLGVASDERLGADRSVACVAAAAKYGAPCIVLDLGTATTLDALNTRGEYMGGCIAVGLRVAANALAQQAALLPQVELTGPEKVLNTTAVGHIQAGMVLGYVGAVEYLVRRAREELGQPECPVVATGGLARIIAGHTGIIQAVDDDLVLEGLRLIYQRERGRE